MRVTNVLLVVIAAVALEGAPRSRRPATGRTNPATAVTASTSKRRSTSATGLGDEPGRRAGFRPGITGPAATATAPSRGRPLQPRVPGTGAGRLRRRGRGSQIGDGRGGITAIIGGALAGVFVGGGIDRGMG